MQDAQAPPTQDRPAGEWLPIAEAARRLGVSIDTARRRLKRGQLVGREVPTPQGHRWDVWLNGLGSTAQATAYARGAPPTQDAQPPHRQEAPELAQLVRELQQQNLELAGRVGFYQAQLEQSRETIKALQAPRVDPESEPASPLRRLWRAFWRRSPQ
jgi:hypothetical protein